MSVAAPPEPTGTSPQEKQGEDFWARHSPNFEFSIANLASIAIHIIVFGLFLYYISPLLHVDERTAPPVRRVLVFDDDRATGPGAAGSEVAQHEAKEADVRRADVDRPLPEVILKPGSIRPVWRESEVGQTPPSPEVIGIQPGQRMPEIIGEDPKPKLPKEGDDKTPAIVGENAPLLTLKKGEPTSSQGRSARWILLFKTENGKDYVSQLAVLKAQIVVFKSKGKFLHFPDLKDLTVRKEIAVEKFPELMNFIDDNSESAKKVAEALGLDFTPMEFVALIPKDVEDELAAKERAYRNRSEKEIYSTTFRILMRDGKYVVTVTDQVLNKK